MTGPIKASDVEVPKDVEAPGVAFKREAERKRRERIARSRAKEAALRAAGDAELQAIRNEQARLKQAFLERQAART